MTTAKLMVGRVELVEVPSARTGARVFAAYSGSVPMAVLCYSETVEAVELVYVDEEYRRLGLATRLLEFAREQTGGALDQSGPDRTDEGHAWAKALGLKVQNGGRRRAYSESEVERDGSMWMFALEDARRSS